MPVRDNLVREPGMKHVHLLPSSAHIKSDTRERSRREMWRAISVVKPQTAGLLTGAIVTRAKVLDLWSYSWFEGAALTMRAYPWGESFRDVM